jgi:PAS domain S-box-containing protein
MFDFLRNLVSSDGFMPHGHCYLWRLDILWLHLIADALIAISYISIPFTLLYIVRKRRDVPFHWMFLCFGMFIVACGATHAMEIWTLWTPTYGLSGIIKAITALASVTTAVLLIKLVPTVLTIPTPAQLSKAHDELRRAHEVLERRVQERMAELTSKNAELADEIAERKRAQDALAKSQRKFQRLADAGIIGVITTDVSGNVLEANHAFLQVVGYTQEDLQSGGVRWDDMTPPEHRMASAHALEQLRATGVATPWEKEYIRKDGSRVPVLVGVAALDATADEYIAFVLDLTERKRAAEAIHKLEQQREADATVRALLEAAPDAMVISDERDRIVLVNAKTEQLFGYARADLLDTSLDILVPERFRPTEVEHRANYFKHPIDRRRTMSGERQLVGLRKDGSEFPADVSLSTLQTNAGMLVSTTIRDVTLRKQAEETLRRAKEAAEAANAELETFSYSVAHDLRSPLRGISGYSTALLEDCGDGLEDQAKEYLTRIVAGCLRMSNIIDALLKLARLTRTEPRFEQVDLTQLGRTVIEQLRTHDPQRVVEFVATDGLGVRGDPDLLRLLLDNLLGNAWKFTGKQPSARVELGSHDVDGSPVYYVRDNGAGFDARLVNKLFVPFRRLHSSSEFDGTGLGLATVQRIVRIHGGRVWAEGAEAEGATFRFTLPPASRTRTISRSPLT